MVTPGDIAALCTYPRFIASRRHHPVDQKVRQAKLDYLPHSPAALTALAENYVGLPFED